jgi:hypothetical protein
MGEQAYGMYLQLSSCLLKARSRFVSVRNDLPKKFAARSPLPFAVPDCSPPVVLDVLLFDEAILPKVQNLNVLRPSRHEPKLDKYRCSDAINSRSIIVIVHLTPREGNDLSLVLKCECFSWMS